MTLANSPTSTEHAPEKPHGSIRRTFLLTVIPLSLLPFILVGSLVFFRSRALLAKQVRTQLDINIHHLAIELDNLFTTAQIRLDAATRRQGFEQAIQELIDNPNLSADALTQVRANTFKELNQLNSIRGDINFTSFLILDANGHVRLASNPAWERLTFAPELATMLTRGQTGSALTYSPAEPWKDQLVLFVHARYTSPRGGTVYLVGLLNQIPLEAILLDATDRQFGSNVYLITHNEEFIGVDFYTEDLVVLEPTRSQINALLPLKEQYKHTSTTEKHYSLPLRSFDQTPTLATYTWIDTLDAGLVFEVPVAIAFRQFQTLTPFTALALIITLGIIGISLWFASNRFIQPIQALTETAAQFARGNWKARTTEQRDDELGLLARTFNHMAEELSGLYQSLSAQVAEQTLELQARSKQLEATALVAREAAGIRDLDSLLNSVTELISQYFGYYHAGIFLLDENKHFAVLQAANSEGGKRMLARGHKLGIGQTGVVGRVAATGKPRIALDVGEDRYYFDNPDLPETHSEMALPLKIQNRIIGVLDVQSKRTGAFTPADAEVLQILADQIALAIENARLLEQSQATVEELQSLYSQQVTTSWNRILGERTKAYHFDRVRVKPAQEGQLAALPKTHVAEPQIHTDVQGYQYLTIPIRLRDLHFGDISLRKDPDAPPWTLADRQLAEEVGRQIAAALENARLLEETQRRAAFEQIRSEIASRMRETLDIETVLRTAARELRQALELAEVEVRMGEMTPPADN